uniref:transmembrane protease serine 9-like isoform X2 n=1 Tax=Solea senegalensis TaxID=28829 RepID=UPI001CD868E4|nr:transmembrane protease serine 9-like isoform X2 [Solea senegalensis]
MRMLSVVCLLSVCLLCRVRTQASVDNNTAAGTSETGETGGNWTQTNETFSDSAEPGAIPGLFGFRDIAGKRSFLLELEAESRIIGGQEAWAHSWPWQVCLRFAAMPACGGAIIGPLWVVSAAHCFKRFKKAAHWSVVAGKHDLDNPKEAGQQIVGVAAIVRHHGYNPRTKENDIALLKLEQPLIFTATIKPIHLWTKALPLFRECTITGWGSTRENGPRVNRLQEVNVTVLPPDVCNQYYSGRMRSSMFCAGKEGGGVDACQGDSGGPLSCFTGTRYEVAGLVSWGVGCGRGGRPGVYTKLHLQAQWLYNHLNDVMHDDVEDEEEKCGRQQSSGCKPPGVAALSLSSLGELSVENLAESCPYFWPWQVSLQSKGRHYCSGVLVHRRWVLTAKHCNVKAKEDVVVLGTHNLRFSSSQTIPVDEVLNLPQDSGFPPKPDLSLLRLSVPARFNSNVSPACLPDEDEELNDSWSCFTVGWGATAATGNMDSKCVHHVGLSLVNRTTCEDRWGSGLITDSHICAHPAGSASCMGDSGAPLYCRKRGAYFLFGVVTWGSQRCDLDKPSVFTATAGYHSWISDVTEEDDDDVMNY